MANYIRAYPTRDQFLKASLEGVREEWLVSNTRPIIESKLIYLHDQALGLCPSTSSASSHLITDSITSRYLPPPELILEVFRWMSPKEVRVIILGMDPYPNAQDACGVAFQSFADEMPLAARRINANLLKHGHITERDATCSIYQTWLKQGVLLMNSALTLVEGKSGSHAVIWSNADFIPTLLRNVNPNTILLTVGGNARQAASSLPFKNKIDIVHPSAPGKEAAFISNDVFGQINRMLTSQGSRPIDWRPGQVTR